MAGNPSTPNPLKKNYTTSKGGKVLTGNRSKVYINGELVGIFDSCTVSGTIATEPVFILGRSSAAEIAVTAADVVNVSCSGFRVVGAGVHTLPAVPLVQDLINLDPFTIVVVDRQTGETLETILNCVPVNHSANYNARATSKVNITYMGTIAYNEDNKDSDPGVNLP